MLRKSCCFHLTWSFVPTTYTPHTHTTCPHHIPTPHAHTTCPHHIPTPHAHTTYPHHIPTPHAHTTYPHRKPPLFIQHTAHPSLLVRSATAQLEFQRTLLAYLTEHHQHHHQQQQQLQQSVGGPLLVPLLMSLLEYHQRWFSLQHSRDRCVCVWCMVCMSVLCVM